MFWLCGFGGLLSVWFGERVLSSGGDAWSFVWLAGLFLVGCVVSWRR
jgi:hypothetical protein